MTEMITVTRTFAAPREAVWQALTRPEHFAVWFGTAAVDVPHDSLLWNAAAGNPWSAVMNLPDGSTKGWIGEFVDVEEPSKLVFTITDDPEDPESATPVTVVLTEGDGNTLVTLAQHVPGFAPEQQAAVAAGYRAFFDTLGKDVLGTEG